MGLYQLGTFDFISIHGAYDRAQPPNIPRETVIPVIRAGVDGVGFIRAGVHSEPFQMRSVVDLASPSQVRTLIAGYRELVGKEAQTLIWGDLDYSTAFSTKYVVLDVQMLAVRLLSAACGGKNSGNVLAEAIWTLQPVPINLDPPEA